MSRNKDIIAIIIILPLCILAIAANSIIACRIIAFTLSFICIIRGMRERSLVNPYYLFVITPISLMMYANVSDLYMGDLELRTWLIAIINMGAFIIALTVAPTYSKEPLYYDIGEDSNIRRHIVVLSLLGFIPIYANFLFGIQMPFYSVFSLFYIPALVCALYSKQKKYILIIILLTIIPWFTNVGKTTVLAFVLCCIISYEAFNELTAKARTKLLILCITAGVIMLLTFSFANQSRGTSTADSKLQYYTTYGQVIWSKGSLWFMPYMYLTTPWSNLQFLMTTQNVRTNGLWLLRPFIAYFQLDGLFKAQYALIAKSSFNTFGFIAPHFKDFGFLGSIIPSFILGVFVKWVYTRAQSTKRPLDIACYVFTAQAVVEMFFSNHFLQQSYPITIVILIAIYRVVFCGRMRIGRNTR